MRRERLGPFSGDRGGLRCAERERERATGHSPAANAPTVYIVAGAPLKMPPEPDKRADKNILMSGCRRTTRCGKRRLMCRTTVSN